MRIVCDMDEVLADFVGEVLKRWNAMSGKEFTKEDITSWRMEEVLGKSLDGRSAEGLIDEWIAEPGFYEKLEPIPGAIDGMQFLMDMGHDIVIATSIPEVALHAFDGKRKWMRKYFPKMSMKNFMASSRKGLIDGDIIIDDGGHNIIDWCRMGKTGAIIMNAAWNEYLGDRVLGVPVKRVYDWNHVLTTIDKIAAEKFDARTRVEEGVYT